MKRFVLLWLVFLVFALSPARAAEPYISVDFRLSWGVPWVDVELSGSTYSFVLDTGAKFTVLSSGVADVVSPGWDKRGRRSDL